MAYSFLIGIWKSVKNTVIVLLPALGAGYAAFLNNVPQDYHWFFMALGGFFAYLVKNYFQNK